MHSSGSSSSAVVQKVCSSGFLWPVYPGQRNVATLLVLEGQL